MVNSLESGDFKIRKQHENCGIKFLKTSELNTIAIYKQENLLFSDFVQGKVGNCALLAVLASLSQRDEFLLKFAPEVKHTSNGIELHFNMFYEGELKVVTIDDALPFDENGSLIYARSLLKNNLFLASFFEKVFVKHCCNFSYDQALGVSPQLVFSTFSNGMNFCCEWDEEDTKQNFMQYIKFEVDNKSSVVLAIIPSIDKEPDEKFKFGHAYTVMNYNVEHKAVKLYDPRCAPKYISNDNLHPSLTMNASEGELWVKLDQIKKREIAIRSLYSDKMYRSVKSIKRKIEVSSFNLQKRFKVCKVTVKKTSTFMINLFLYSHLLDECTLFVKTCEKQKVKLNLELPAKLYINSNPNKGEAKTEYFQRFKLEPNSYIISLKMKLAEQINGNQLNILMKVGSTSKCRFETLIN